MYKKIFFYVPASIFLQSFAQTPVQKIDLVKGQKIMVTDSMTMKVSQEAMGQTVELSASSKTLTQLEVKDVADNWVHEGFTSYSENLYTEYLFGKEAGADYVIGSRKGIDNDVPIIGDYEVNRDGSGDMYAKAASMLHMIRQIVNNDSVWKLFLRDINKTFWHTTTTSKDIEAYMINYLKMDLQKANILINTKCTYII